MQHTSIDYFLLHLSLIEGVGPATTMRIMEHISMEHIDQLYTMSTQELASRCSLSLAQAQTIVAGLADTGLLERTCEVITKNSISWMTLATPDYPTLLKHIYAPPPVVYWYGILPYTQHTIAVVGSRNATAYGQRIIDRVLPDLIHAGGTIISGGALGIDTMAHRKSLELGGNTTVVLGSGLLHWYPHANKKLFQAIVDAGGCIMSPFAPNLQPYPGNFPARNRIIAGLSRITLVVQASQKSGALITAQYSLDQGREVMAVPGAIDDPLSQGCNTLIAQGATVVADAMPILQALGLSPLVAQKLQTIAITSAPTTSTHDIPPVKTSAILTPSEKLLHLCKQPHSIDELIDAALFDTPDQLVQLLFDLQLEDKIEQNFTGRWQAHL